MPLWITNLIAALLKPLVERLADAVAKLVNEYLKQKEIERIDFFVKHMSGAKTDEERIAAAREAAEALRNL